MAVIKNPTNFNDFSFLFSFLSFFFFDNGASGACVFCICMHRRVPKRRFWGGYVMITELGVIFVCSPVVHIYFRCLPRICLRDLRFALRTSHCSQSEKLEIRPFISVPNRQSVSKSVSQLVSQLISPAGLVSASRFHHLLPPFFFVFLILDS